MPISYRHPDRSIAPDALAFPDTGQRGSAIIATYQDELVTNVTITNTVIATDNAYVDRANREQMGAVANAEMRSKDWVSEYERVFEWDINANIYVSTNTDDRVQFDHEVIRSMGCELVGAPSNIAAYWRYTCPPDAEGQYWIYSHLLVSLTPAAGVNRARMSIYVNGIQRRVVDQIDPGYAGETPIVDCKLSGGCHVPLNNGDIVTIVLRLVASATIDMLLPNPASCYGYVTGHRTRCDMDSIDSIRNGANISGAAPGNSYTFT